MGSACGSRTSRPAAARVTPRVVSPVSSLLRTEACRYLSARFYAIRITCGPNRSLDPRPPGGDDQGQVQVCGPWETPVRSWGQWCWHSLASPDPTLDAQESVQLTWAGGWWLRCVQGRGGARAGTRAGRSPCFRTGQGSACRWPGLSVQAARAQPEGAAGRRSGSSCRNGRGNAASGQLPGAQGPGCSWGARARSRTPGPATPARLSSGSACQRASLCSRGNRGTACHHVSRAPQPGSGSSLHAPGPQRADTPSRRTGVCGKLHTDGLIKQTADRWKEACADNISTLPAPALARPRLLGLAPRPPQGSSRRGV